MKRRQLLIGFAAAGAVAAACVGWWHKAARDTLLRTRLRSGYAPGAAGAKIYYEVHGTPQGPPVFLVQPILASSRPGNARDYLAYLADRYQVLLADYPYGVGLTDSADPSILTADQVCDDYLSIATAAGFSRFAIAGYSWGANTAEVLATRSNRITALAVGGWPALGGPYSQLLQLATAIDRWIPWDALQSQQYETYYRSLLSWPERCQVTKLSGPRLNYVDSKDSGELLGVSADIVGRFRANRVELDALGWETTEVHSGHGHRGGMSPEIAGPLLRAFFDKHLQAVSMGAA